VGNVKSVSKKLEDFSFFANKWPQKNGKKIRQATQPDGVQSISAKKSNFKLAVKTRLKNLAFALQKNPRIEIFSANNRPKNLAAANSEYDKS